MAARVAGVLPRVLSLELVDEQLCRRPFPPQLVLTVVLEHQVAVPPDHAGPGFGGLTAEHGRPPGLHLQVGQLGREKDGLSWKGSNRTQREEEAKRRWR